MAQPHIRLANTIRRFLPFIEFLVLLGLLVAFLFPDYQSWVIGIGFSLLALAYFYIAYLPAPEGTSIYMTFLLKIFAIGLTVGIVGLLFSMLGFPGNQTLMTAGLILILICLVVTLIQVLIRPKTVTKARFWAIRGVVIGIVLVLEMQFPDMI